MNAFEFDFHSQKSSVADGGAAALARDLVAIAPSLIARKGQSVDHGLKQGTGRRAKQAWPSSNTG
ncbi:hypothetical protein I6F14_23890 [Bradyrhizobium sp. IC3069]|uniref:Uncharacterized protein n=1 Tax=Bradyrhizobium yuanmingense TaxID=108015 RepID=A0ABV4GPL8_9BRAD|nr:hypothetical protein [Bradyrhizobium yuanmingense]MCA1463911.1 hypothetical protein [Bradyrhizobium sp. NBAIM18]MCA1520978.1 hypothetical protein [Bradyrhizobium sp. IC3069]